MRFLNRYCRFNSPVRSLPRRPCGAGRADRAGRPTSSHPPAVPAGLEGSLRGQCELGRAQSHLPDPQYNGYTFWAWSDNQNAVAMAIVAYDSNGVAVKQWNRNGARYIWNITVDPVAETVSFVGQSKRADRPVLSDLFIPRFLVTWHLSMSARRQ